MEKNIDYYISLPYTTEIVPIPEAEGGGYMARMPQFGAQGIVGDGETIQDALDDLYENRKERFQQYLQEGREIPEPDEMRQDYSGRFVVRIPRFLHGELARAARRNGVSLNQYVSALLAMNARADRIDAMLNGIREEVRGWKRQP